ncbi:DUF2158 domain-containing protein [Aeromonas caviae]|uniref:DUF2158 domain-containing protein n=1 Tax=Aeromonas caviae TaxID=648 RepID=UPI002B46D40D|nr:DUF2158 domain-containing protein [Aeromonas caviae]
MRNKHVFYPGQLVQLRSGSSTMTVNQIDPASNYVSCVWFDYEKSPELNEKRLAACVLEPLKVQTFSPNQSAETLQEGDVVKLRSGGPLITIQAIRKDDAVCIWFDMALREIMPCSGNIHLNALFIED